MAIAPELFGSEFIGMPASPTTFQFIERASVASWASGPNNGGYVAVWQSEIGSIPFYDIHAKRFDAFGHEVGSTIRVTDSVFSHERSPQVATLPDGGFVVVWEGADITTQIFDVNGHPVTADIVVDSGSDPNIAVGAGANAGQFIVTYNQSGKILAQLYSFDGTFLSGPVVVAAETVGVSDVAALPDGGFVVVYTEVGSDADVDVRFQHITPAFSLGDTALVVDDQGDLQAQDQADPTVAVLSDGHIVFGFIQSGDVYARILVDVGGMSGEDITPPEWQGPAFVVANSTAVESQASVAAGPDGTFLVTYVGYNNIFGSLYTNAGSLVGAIGPINTTTDGSQREPAVTALADGRYAVLWTHSFIDSLGNPKHLIRGQILDGRDTNIIGTNTDDVLVGHDTGQSILDDIVQGLAGDDALFGLDGDDTLIGGGGEDDLDGGLATDTAAFSGNWADYVITQNPDGSFTIVDARLGAPDDTDTVRNIELFQFIDGTRTAAELLNTAPVITSDGGGDAAAVMVPENATVVTTITATDPDTGQILSYEIVGGADQDKFQIDSLTGALSFVSAPDFEAPGNDGGDNVYEIEVSVSDGHGGTDTQTIAITVTDQNEAPTAVAFDNTTTAIDENTDTTAGIKVADIVVIDDALGDEILTLAGEDAGSFEIIGTELYLKADVLDFETKSSYVVQVAVDDPRLGTGQELFSARFSVNVTDVNEAPTALNFRNITPAIDENTDTAAGVKVADIQVIDDALGIETLTLTGSDAPLFELIGNALYLKAGVLDFETKSSYSVKVAVDDPTLGEGPELSALFNIDLTDLNEAPTAVGFKNAITKIAENTDTTAGVKVADIVVTDDALGGENLSLLGSDASSFEIIGTALYLKAGVLDFEAKASYSVVVVVDDPTLGGPGLKSELFTVGLTNVPGVTIAGTAKADTIDATTTAPDQPLPTGEEDTITGDKGKDTIDARGGNDVVDGGAGADRLIGGAGNDLLTGGDGKDTFVFGLGFGEDTITDFIPGHDVIEIDHNIFADFADVLASSQQAGSNVLITVDGSNSVTLQGVTLTSLITDDFRFV